jgi:phospholipid-binding lipoprotein MlaA
MKTAHALCLATTLLLGACSTPSPESLAEHDPWEATNRDTFALNVWVERNVASPVVDVYRTVLPQPARDGLHNAVTNLRAPIILANDVLQARPKQAVRTIARVLINSTIGIGGLIDVAGKIGIPYHDNDFGITLGVAGAPEGSYLMLPFLGPKPPRDLLGMGVDSVFDPFTWSRFSGRHILLTARSGLDVVDTADRNLDQLKEIERSSIDFYASTRNLYRQSRNAQIRGDNPLFQNLPDL